MGTLKQKIALVVLITLGYLAYKKNHEILPDPVVIQPYPFPKNPIPSPYNPPKPNPLP